MGRGFIVAMALGLVSPGEPFLVHVTSSLCGDPAVVRTIEEGRDEIEKRIRSRKRSFTLTPDREKAELVIDLHAYWNREELERGFETGHNPPHGSTGIEVSYVVEHHHLPALMSILGSSREMTGVQVKRSGGSVRGAARDLVEQIERRLRKDYPRRFR